MYKMKSALIAVILALSYFGISEAGECCLAYKLSDFSTTTKWCPDYCCETLGIYSCCDDESQRATGDDVTGFCAEYFKHHVWAAVLLAIGCLAVLIGLICLCTCCCCGACCCGACCRRNTPGTVYVNSGMPSTTVATSNVVLNSVHAGYDQP